ncbi:M15 family metallopeptidase [Marinimicrobium agarilyticum]|uniref:M15 family metallopeptidase n=1 Tax=Marinimicrobium agarilyticum TaxID=306546 RepID=UPI000410FF30|nr:M15 family metallopeptidase [Marinimicrobium agarilyticum]
MNFADQSHKKGDNVEESRLSIPSIKALVGEDESALVALDQTHVHRGVVAPLERLTAAAEDAGFSLCVASGYRSFERQKAIWTAKTSGERPVLDERGRPLDIERLNELELVLAILRWSALPGSSRHHWGTDMDVYDASALPRGSTLQLTREECDAGGPLYRFHQWLTDFLASDANPGFYRPYDVDRGGVAPEPWHLSFAPIANAYARALTVERLSNHLREHPLPLQATIEEHLTALFERYVRVPPGPESPEGEPPR